MSGASRNSHFVPIKVEGPGQKYEFVPRKALMPDSLTCMRTTALTLLALTNFLKGLAQVTPFELS
jgi:hypothetical protein